MKIADYSIGHGPTVIMFMITAVVFGVLALVNIPQERVPDIAKPSILIVTQYPGVGPKDVEQQITKPIEDAVSTLSGITKITSDSVDSFSLITLEFNWNENLDNKLPSLREKVNTIMSQLPSDISGPPEFYTFSATDLPILTYVVRGKSDIETLKSYVTNQVVPYFQRVAGVAAVNVKGTPDQEVKVSLDLRRLSGMQISPVDVMRLLQANNVSLPGGSVSFHGGSLNVRSVGEFSSLEAIRNVVVGVHDKTAIRLRDIATVSMAPEKRTLYSLYNEEDSLVIDVTKQRGSDTITIIDKIKAAAKRIEQREHGNIRFVAVTDESVDIHRSVRSVANSALLGAVLAVFILLLVLHNLRSTVVVAISIPLSVVAAVAGLYGFGRTLNLVTLGGLTVAIGMVVDNSIVVLENSYKHLERGSDPVTSASRGTSEVVGAVIASTITSLAVFVPILFVQGFVGIILQDISLAVIFALGASLIIAVFVVPFLFSRIVRPNGGSPRVLAGASERVFSGMENSYRRALAWSLENSGFIIAAAVVLLATSLGAVRLLGTQFLPDTDTSQIIMNIRTPPDYTLEETKGKALEVEKLAQKLAPEIKNSVFYVGESNVVGIGNSSSVTRAVLNLTPAKERRRSIFQIMDLLQRKIPESIPDIKLTVQNGGIAASVAAALGGSGYQIAVSGNDFNHVRDAAESIEKILSADPDVSSTSLDVNFDQQDLAARFNPTYMSNLGVLPSEAGLTLRIVLNGMDAGTYRSGGNDYTVYLTSDAAGKAMSSNLLNELAVKTQRGNFVDYSAFTTLATEPAYSDIPHLEKVKSIEITANLIKSDTRMLSERVIPEIRALSLPADVTWQVTGQTQQMEESFRSLAAILVIAIFLVYVVMVVQFQRFAQPLIIMGSIPFILIGAVGSLLAFGSSLSIIAFLGLITLAGTVVNNAIVLVDYMNMLRRDYRMGLLEAVLEGGRMRLRPILMTTMTTILGVIPMALTLGEGSSLTASLGQVIGGGLLTSTLITLFLIPTLYYLLERRLERRR